MSIATSVAQWARGKVKHDHIKASTLRVSDIRSPDVNLVHIRRGRLQLPVSSLKKHVKENPQYYARAAVATRDPEASVAEQLLGGSFRDTIAHKFLLQDISSVLQLFRDELGYEELNVKLEVVRTTSCPKWHADHVGMRCLSTYVGEGTWYIENRHVQRSWDWHRGSLSVSVASVDEEHAQQAGPGDLLLLKGHQWRDNFGLGAVHRSPDVHPDVEDDARLLLTVDDVLSTDCACGLPHS